MTVKLHGGFEGRPSKQAHMVPITVLLCMIIYIAASVSRPDFKDALARGAPREAEVQKNPILRHHVELTGVNRIIDADENGIVTSPRVVLLERTSEMHVPLQQVSKSVHELSDTDTNPAAYLTCADVREGYWPKPGTLMRLSKYSQSGEDAGAWRKLARETSNRLDRCALVGSHSSALGNDFGAAIDTHDVVLRLLEEDPGFSKVAGSKTTFWLSDGQSDQRDASGRRLLKEANGGLYFKINSNETIGTMRGPTRLWAAMGAQVKGTPGAQVLHVQKSLIRSSGILPLKYRELLQCSFSSGSSPIKVPTKHKPSASWVAMYMLMNGCKHVTAYGLLQEPTLYKSNGRIPHHLIRDNTLTPEIRDAVEEVLFRSLGNARYMEVCGQDAPSDCGMQKGIPIY